MTSASFQPSTQTVTRSNVFAFFLSSTCHRSASLLHIVPSSHLLTVLHRHPCPVFYDFLRIAYLSTSIIRLVSSSSASLLLHLTPPTLLLATWPKFTALSHGSGRILPGRRAAPAVASGSLIPASAAATAVSTASTLRPAPLPSIGRASTLLHLRGRSTTLTLTTTATQSTAHAERTTKLWWAIVPTASKPTRYPSVPERQTPESTATKLAATAFRLWTTFTVRLSIP